MKLTIRKNGKYYQVGYYENSKWINVKHIGTAEQLLKTLERTVPKDIPDNILKNFIEIYQNTPKIPQEQNRYSL